ncbi:MAG TPA: sigma-70 family RNA polymerase sigma factor, partial [Vicinamibacterales bacterium]|nr:sigma-70 family RNA polymerase sigma factor [Vicinamibacterales bacterium]
MCALRSGDCEAFDTLFDRYRDPVWRFFRRRVADAGRCEELVQDVFVALYQNVRRYEPRSSVRSYVFGIAFNMLHAERRRLLRDAREPLVDEPSAAPDPAAALWVRDALASLDAGAREIVMLREYEQLSYQEIAELLRLPLNTVRSRLFRARMDLKAALLRQTGDALQVAARTGNR